jgi:hypothetical protein
MRFENNSPTSDEAATPPDAGSGRRRQRPWSAPSAAPASPTKAAGQATIPESFERPLTEKNWLREGMGAGEVAEGKPPATVNELVAIVGDLKAEVASLREELTARVAEQAGSLVTGPELAASIEALGNTLGGGLAALLTEHRNLLARDLDAAAERILEEVSQRLRASTGQTVDGVEDRVRSLLAKQLTELGEQLDLRLDGVQSDVTGLRAVMLEIPDQTVVLSRLDGLADTISAAARTRESQRVSPAMAGAIERAVAGPLERMEDSIASLTETVEELGGGGGVDSEAIATLAKEVTALRRRISLRSDAPVPPVEDEGPDEDEDTALHLATIRIDDDAPVRKRAPRRGTTRRGA